MPFVAQSSCRRIQSIRRALSMLKPINRQSHVHALRYHPDRWMPVCGFYNWACAAITSKVYRNWLGFRVIHYHPARWMPFPASQNRFLINSVPCFSVIQSLCNKCNATDHPERWIPIKNLQLVKTIQSDGCMHVSHLHCFIPISTYIYYSRGKFSVSDLQLFCYFWASLVPAHL